MTFVYCDALLPSEAKIAAVQESSLIVLVEYNSASVERSSSWKPKTNMSGSRSRLDALDDEALRRSEGGRSERPIESGDRF